MKNSFLLLSLLLFLTNRAQTTTKPMEEWTVVSSSVTFKIKNAGITINGSMEGLIAKIIFDETKLYGNLMEASIDNRTIKTGIDARDNHLKKEDYFYVDKYPVITMKATLFTKEKDGSFKGFFKLTIKDKTRDVLVPFTFMQKDNKGMFKGEFTINRLDYGVGTSSFVLSDNAVVSIQVMVVRK